MLLTQFNVMSKHSVSTAEVFRLSKRPIFGPSCGVAYIKRFFKVDLSRFVAILDEKIPNFGRRLTKMGFASGNKYKNRNI